MKFNALDRGFVVGKADFGPSVHLAGSHALDLYRQLMSSMSTRGKMGGGALTSILQRWLMTIEERTTAAQPAAGEPNAESTTPVAAEIRRTVARITEGAANSYDFGRVLSSYYQGFTAGEAELFVSQRTGSWEVPSTEMGQPRERDRRISGVELCSFATRWLRGEYNNRSDAKRDLQVTSIPDSDTWFDQLKTFTALCRDAGYKGVFVTFDELHHVLNNSSSIRQKNWDQLLTIYNAAAQGQVQNFGILLAATHEAFQDPRLGMCSYAALRSRLMSSVYSHGEYGTLNSPVIELKQLTVKEQAVLLQRIDRCHLRASAREEPASIDDIATYLDRLNRRVGARVGNASGLVSMRDICRGWVDALNGWAQHPEVTLATVLTNTPPPRATSSDESAPPQADLDLEASVLQEIPPVANDLAADFGVVGR